MHVPIQEKVDEVMLPLSLNQQRIWLMCKMYPFSVAMWNNISVKDFHGKFDSEIFVRACVQFIETHRSLRSMIVERDGVGYQYIDSQIERFKATIREVNLANGSMEDVNKYIHQERLRKQQLEEPLFSIIIFHLNPSLHVVLFNPHHIISDGRSLSIFWDDVALFYNALSLGQSIEVKRHQYSDFLDVQSRSADYLDSLESYWLSEFESKTTDLSIPYDFPKSGVEHFSASTVSAKIDEEVARNFKALCMRHRISPSSAMLSLFYLVLRAYTHTDDVTIGTYFNGRNIPPGEKKVESLFSIFGMFTNTVAVRLLLSEEDSILNMLKAVHQKFAAAFARQAYPLQHLVQKLKVKDLIRGGGLFRVGFNYLSYPSQPSFDALVVTDHGFKDELFLENDITLRVIERGNELTVALDYRTALLGKETIDALHDNLVSLVGKLSGCLNMTIAELDVNSDAQKRVLMTRLAINPSNGHPPAMLLQQFVDQVGLNPTATALVFRDTEISYSELHLKSNDFVRRLIALGVVKGAFVPVLIDHSVELVVSFLSLLKIGAVYVPIDTQWPDSRINSIIRELMPPVILVGKDSPQIESNDSLLVNFRELDMLTDNIQIEVSEDDLMYLIYTSGSTGKPKGVKVSYGGVLNRLTWMNSHFGVASAKTVLHTTRYVFDSSVWQFMWPLINGGRVIVMHDYWDFTADKIADMIQRFRVTIIDFVPSVFDVFVKDVFESPSLQQKLYSLHDIILGGEAIIVHTALKFRELFPAIQLTNLYGPTEATIGCVFHRVQGNEKKIPIGRPISNMEVYIVDSNGRLCTRGAIGEILIGGPGVAKGYYNDVAHTERVFIKSPFKQCASLYKTGDLGRWTSADNLEFLGRLDEQISLRGLRIEPAEIEIQIRQFPGIIAACVTMSKDTDGASAIVAYVISDKAIDATGLKKFLKNRLPIYFVPTYIVEVDQFPLNASGKINKKALPAPDRSNLSVNTSFEQDTLTRSVRSVWCDVLGVDAMLIPVDASFFDHGGHSLKAMEMVSRINTMYDVKLSLVDFFNDSTIEGITAAILQAPHSTLSRIPITNNSNEDYPVSAAQRRMFALNQLAPGSVNYNIPLTLICNARVDISALSASFAALVKRHESLRTTFHVKDGELVQRIHQDCPLEVIEGDVTIRQFVKPFDLSLLPLFRVGIRRKKSGEEFLLIDLHHIVCDGLSVDILLKELVVFYSDGVNTLNERPLQYKDFCLWELDESNRKLPALEKFWTEKLAGFRELELPIDFPRPNIQQFDGAGIKLHIHEDNFRNLIKAANANRVTLFSFLLTVFTVFLHRITGQSDIIVGTPVSGRFHPDISSTVGMFSNTLVLRNTVEPSIALSDLLQRFNANLLHAFDNQEYPFDLLVDALGIKRDLSRNPVFNVIFAFQNDYVTAFRGDKIVLEKVKESDGFSSSKVDLAFWCKANGKGIIIDIEYSTHVFLKTTVEELSDVYMKILQNAIILPNCKVVDLVSGTENVPGKNVPLDFVFD